MLFESIRDILVELLDLEADAIQLESYLVRDLGVESIDFLELAVALNERFKIPVHDDTVFLRHLRLHLTEAEAAGQPPLEFLKPLYGFLSEQRLAQIVSDLDGGPVIQVQDLMGYVTWQLTRAKAA